MILIKDHKLTHKNYFQNSDYVSNSMLNHLTGKSPAHLRFMMDNPQPATPAMILGSAVHMNILQPKQFNKNYAVLPKIDRRTKVGKEEFAKFSEESGDKTIINQADFELIEQLTLKVSRDSLVKNLLVKGKSEEIIVWKNEEFNVYCKGMLDYWRKDHGIIVDLKTTQDCSTYGFSKSIMRFKYHKQAAFYMDAVGADEFYIVAMEKAPPFVFNVFKLDKSLISEGRKLYNKDLEVYAYCLENNYWPEYGYDFWDENSEREVEIINSSIFEQWI